MIGATPGTKLAKECFTEAVNLQGGTAVLAKKDPVQFNLLNGLANIAHAIEQLQQQVTQLTKEVQKLKSK